MLQPRVVIEWGETFLSVLPFACRSSELTAIPFHQFFWREYSSNTFGFLHYVMFPKMELQNPVGTLLDSTLHDKLLHLFLGIAGFLPACKQVHALRLL